MEDSTENEDVNLIVDFLFTEPNKIGHVSYGYMSAAHKAALKGDVTTLQMLIDEGIDTTIADSLGREPIHCAAALGQLDAVKLLVFINVDLEAKDKMGCTPLHLATSGGFLDVVTILLNSYVNINAKNELKQTALHLAVLSSHKEMVSLLIEHGAKLNIQNYYGNTPLHFCHNFDILKTLIRYGADPTIKNKDSKTALDSFPKYVVKYIKAELQFT